jgi:hypothetical protein
VAKPGAVALAVSTHQEIEMAKAHSRFSIPACERSGGIVRKDNILSFEMLMPEPKEVFGGRSRLRTNSLVSHLLNIPEVNGSLFNGFLTAAPVDGNCSGVFFSPASKFRKPLCAISPN